MKYQFPKKLRPYRRTTSVLSYIFPLLASAILAGSAQAKDLGSIWCIGDSITLGNADGDDTSTPRSELFTLLKEKNYEFSFMGHSNKNPEGLPTNHPRNRKYIIHSGEEGKKIGAFAGRYGLYKRMGNIKSSRPSIVLIMLGSEDIGSAYKIETADQRMKELVQFLSNIPRIGEPTFLIGAIPPNRRTEAERTNVILFNEKLPGIAQDLRAEGIKVHFVDHYKPLDSSYDTCMQDDNFHPNGAGNKIIAHTWL